MKPRSALAARERAARSRLAQWAHRGEWLRGTLVKMRHTCGKARCRCVRGEKHESWYLAYSEKGRRRMVYVPRDWLLRVRGWVATWHAAGECLETVSQEQLRRLRVREEE